MSTDPLLHAILAWDGASAEIPLCGSTDYSRTICHVYVTCPACRAHLSFRGDAKDAPWPLPQTVQESTEHLQRMRPWIISPADASHRTRENCPPRKNFG